MPPLTVCGLHRESEEWINEEYVCICIFFYFFFHLFSECSWNCNLNHLEGTARIKGNRI